MRRRQGRTAVWSSLSTAGGQKRVLQVIRSVENAHKSLQIALACDYNLSWVG